MLELFPEGFEELEAPTASSSSPTPTAPARSASRQSFGAVRGPDVAADWARALARASTAASRVGSLWVGPPWEEPPPDADRRSSIDPGRAFGTGAHPTTRLCLELLAELAARQPARRRLRLGRARDRGGEARLRAGHGRRRRSAGRRGAAPERGGERGRARRAACRRARRRACPRRTSPSPNIALDVGRGPRRRAPCAARGHLGLPRSEQPRLDGYRIRERRERDGWAADLFERR